MGPEGKGSLQGRRRAPKAEGMAQAEAQVSQRHRAGGDQSE